MEVGNIVQFQPGYGKSASVCDWVRAACKRNTLFRITSVSEDIVIVELIDDEVVQDILKNEIGKHTSLSLRKRNIQLVQNKTELHRRHKAGELSDKHYLDSLTAVPNE